MMLASGRAPNIAPNQIAKRSEIVPKFFENFSSTTVASENRRSTRLAFRDGIYWGFIAIALILIIKLSNFKYATRFINFFHQN
jgi:hypothetical protein